MNLGLKPQNPGGRRELMMKVYQNDGESGVSAKRGEQLMFILMELKARQMHGFQKMKRQMYGTQKMKENMYGFQRIEEHMYGSQRTKTRLS